MLEVLNNIEDIIESNHTINHSTKTRWKMFIPEDYPAVCYQPDAVGEDGDTLAQDFKDETFGITIAYIDEAGVNRDQTDFIQTVRDIKETIRSTGDLNCDIYGMNIQVKFKDRGSDDNLEFIALIQIDGVRPNR